jgi:hypothetical protein
MFNIGDRVRVRAYEDLPEEMKTKGISRITGEYGEIIDMLHSSAKGCTIYKIQLDNYSVPSRVEFIEGSFDLISDLEQVTYTFEFDYAENLVAARMYELKNDSKKLIARGHGHIFHEGALGIAQAASYALKKLYQHLEGDDE